MAACHLLTDDKTQCNIAMMALSMSPPHIRAKTKIHFGSHQEGQYLLTSFGVPRQALPLRLNNEMNLAHHSHWFQKCQRKEEMNEAQADQVASNFTVLATSPLQNIIATNGTPRDIDVLCVGRKVNGGGNERLMAMAVMHSEAYDMSSKKGRKAIMDSMIEEILKDGGRFLKPGKSDSGTKQWLDVPEKEIYEKLGQM